MINFMSHPALWIITKLPEESEINLISKFGEDLLINPHFQSFHMSACYMSQYPQACHAGLL